MEIVFGTFLLAFGFQFFLLPEGLITGGVMGISVLLPINPSLFILCANLVLLVIGFIFLGKEFLIKTVFATLLSPALVFLFEQTIPNNSFIIENIAPEYRLMISAISGSFIAGVGLGIVFRGGGSTGGIDIVQQILNKKFRLPYSIAIFLTDGIVVLISAIHYFRHQQIEYFFFSIIGVLIFSFVIEYLTIEGRSGYTVFIITNKYSEIRDQIYEKTARGVTKIEVFGGYSQEKKDLIVCTIHKKQITILKEILKSVDPMAFIVVNKTQEVIGDGFFKRGYKIPDEISNKS